MTLDDLIQRAVNDGFKPGLMYLGPDFYWWATLHADWAGPKYETARTPERALEKALAAETKKVKTK